MFKIPKSKFVGLSLGMALVFSVLLISFSFEEVQAGGGTPFIGTGTPTDGINAVKDPGWVSATEISFNVVLPGRGNALATLDLMRDATNIYAFLELDTTLLPLNDAADVRDVRFYFDNNNNGVAEAGDDTFGINTLGAVKDGFRTGSGLYLEDTTAVGGTLEGSGAFAANPTLMLWEMSHPLNSADDTHDFSWDTDSCLHIALELYLEDSVQGAETTLWPSSAVLDFPFTYKEYSFSDGGDCAQPTSPTGLDLDASTDDGVSDTDDVTTLTVLQIDGIAESGTTIELFGSNDGGATKTNVGGGVSNGGFTIFTSLLSPGTWEFTARATDAAVNTSPESASPLEVTIVAPTSPTWDGEGVTDSWSDATNWSGDTLPAADASENVHIPGGFTALLDVNYPSTGSSAIGTLTIDGQLIVEDTIVLLNDADLIVNGFLGVDNGGEVIIEDRMENDGNVLIDGTLTIEPFGSYNENLLGLLGELHVASGGVVNMLGTYLSQSSFDTDVVEFDSEFNVYGDMTITEHFQNEGTFTIKDGGYVLIKDGGEFTNGGEETVYIDDGGILETEIGPGIFTNEETVNTDGEIINNGAFDNFGVVNRDCNSVMSGTFPFETPGTVNDVCVPSNVVVSQWTGDDFGSVLDLIGTNDGEFFGCGPAIDEVDNCTDVGIFGTAFSFDQNAVLPEDADQGIEVPDDETSLSGSDLDFTGGDVTIAAWVKVSEDPTGDTNLGTILSKFSQSAATDQYGLFIYDSDILTADTVVLNGAIGGSTGDGTGSPLQLTGGSIPLNTWTHVAMTFEDGVVGIDNYLYVNGVEVDSRDRGQFGGIPASPHGLGIGNEFPGFPVRTFPGLIDDVTLYNYALTPTEISDLVSTTTGTLTIVKNTIGGDGSFDFIVGKHQGPNVGPANIVTSSGTGSDGPNFVAPSALYNVKESFLADWRLTSASCDDGSSIFDGINNVTLIDIGAGDDIVCTFENTKNGTVTLTKSMVNDNGGDEIAGAFDLELDGLTAPQGVPIQVDVGPAQVEIGEADSLPDGYPYPEGYVGTVSGLSDAGCPLGAEIGVDNTDVDALTWGDHITCDVINDDIAPTITLVKVVDNGDNGNNVETDFGMLVDGTLTGNVPVAHTTTVPVFANEDIVIDEIGLPGQYDFTGFSGIDCPIDGVTVLDGIANVVNLLPGEDITCELNNDDIPPTITLHKLLIEDFEGATDPDTFGMFVDGTLTGNLAVAHTTTVPVFANEDIEINEAGIPTVFEFVDFSGGVTCPIDGVADLLGTNNVVNLEEGEDIECFLTNQGVGRITIAKEAIGGEGTFDFDVLTGTTNPGPSAPIDKTFDADTFDTVDTYTGNSGSFQVIAGEYNIRENVANSIPAPASWDLISVICDDGSAIFDGDEIMEGVKVHPGDDVLCTFENLDILPPLLTIPDNVRVEGDNALTDVIVDIDPFVQLVFSDAIDPTPVIVTDDATTDPPSDLTGVYPLGQTDVQYTVTDLAGNPTVLTQRVTVSEVFNNAITVGGLAPAVDQPKWYKDEVELLSGTVFGFDPLLPEQVRVDWGDGTTPDEVAITDISSGLAGSTGTWTATHTYTSDSSQLTRAITSELFSNPTHATSQVGTSVDVLAHDTEVQLLTIPSAPLNNEFWDDNIELTMRLIDSDFTVGQTTGDIDTAAKNIRVTGTAVSVPQDYSTVPGTEDMADTVEENIIAAGLGSTGLHVAGVEINAILDDDLLTVPVIDVDALYNSPAQIAFDITLDPHVVVIDILSQDPVDLSNSVPFDNTFDTNLQIRDTTGELITNPSTGDFDSNDRLFVLGGNALALGDVSQSSTTQDHLTLTADDGGTAEDETPTAVTAQIGVRAMQVNGHDWVTVDVPTLRTLNIDIPEFDANPDYRGVVSTDGPDAIVLDVAIDPHSITVDTQVCNPGDEDVKWDYTSCLETIVTDNDYVAVGIVSPETGELNDDEVCYSDKGVAGENVQCFIITLGDDQVASTGEVTVQAGTADDSGDARNVVTTFDVADAVDEYGNSPVTNEDGGNPLVLNLKPHVTTLPLNPLTDSVENNKFTAIGILTDFDRVLSDSPHALVNFDTGSPSFAKTASSTIEEQLIIFAGDSDLTTARTGGITVSGGDATFDVVHDINVLKMKEGGVIQFSNVPTVAIDIQNLDIEDFVRMKATSSGTPTTQPQTFESIATGVNQETFPEWASGQNYEEDESVVKISGTPDTFYVAKTTHTSDGTNGPPGAFWEVITVNRDFVNFVATVADGIAQVEIIEVSRPSDGEETADISAFRMLEPRGSPPQIFEANFNDIAALNDDLLHTRDTAHTNTFGAGTYFGVATSEQGISQGNEILASFTPIPGTNAYLGSDALPEEFDVIGASWGLGGQEFGEVPDSGAGFSGRTCGSDRDNDGLCSSEEGKDHFTQIPAGFNNAKLQVPVLAGLDYRATPNEEWILPPGAHADVYLELDVMAPLADRLDETALATLQRSFVSGAMRNDAKMTEEQNCVDDPNRCGIRVHIFVDDEIPKIDQLKVWQDFDDQPDDFAHLKSLYFNTGYNRATLNNITGTQISTFDFKGTFNENDDGDCTDGTNSFIGDPTDDIDDACFDSSNTIKVGLTEFIDEDPFETSGNPVNDDMDCVAGGNHFIGDNTDGVADGCYDSDNLPVDDRIPGNDEICGSADGMTFYFLTPGGTDHLDGVFDDCFDESNNLRTAVSELINEDYVEDRYDWIIDGIVLQTPQDDFYTGTRGRIIVEEQINFTGNTLPKIEGFSTWIADGGVSDTVYKNLKGQMLNSVSEYTQAANSFILRSESTFDAIDTNTVDPNGVDTGDVKVRFNVPTGTDVAGAVHGSWRISPDVITSADDARASYYHYGIIADSIGPCGPSGLAELLGNDIIISLGCGFGGILDPTPDPNNTIDGVGQPQSAGTAGEQARALMHELGHNFDLLHGGPRLNVTTGVPNVDADINCKPNYDSTMSYTHQSTVYLGDSYDPHFSSGLIQKLDEANLPAEDVGLKSKQNDGEPGRRIVFQPANGDWKTDRVTPDDGSSNNLINWDGSGGTPNPSPGAIDVNFIPGLSGCEAEPLETYDDYDDWNSLNLIFAGEGVSFDGISACTTCISDFTSSNDDDAVSSFDWFDGLLRHNQLSPPNPDIFTDPITQEVEIGQNIDVSFQYFNCNPNLTTVPDLCRDPGVVKKLGFYAEPVDGSTPYTVEAECGVGEEGCEDLTNLEGEEFTITLSRACSEIPEPTIGTGGFCPDSEDVTLSSSEFTTFHLHEDGITSWHHIGIDTTGMLSGHYSAEISVSIPESDPRDLFDYNNQLFNPNTGNFVPAVFEEFIPDGALTGGDGNRVTFLVNIVEGN